MFECFLIWKKMLIVVTACHGDETELVSVSEWYKQSPWKGAADLPFFCLEGSAGQSFFSQGWHKRKVSQTQ